MNKRWKTETRNNESELVPLRHGMTDRNNEDSTYESFEACDPEELEADFLNNALGEVEYGQYTEQPTGQSTDEQFEDDSSEFDITRSLPSAELRKIHSLARLGTLKHVKVKEPRNSVDIFDGHHDEPASSHITVVSMMEDEAHDADEELDIEYLELDPTEMENIRDMTTTMDRKKSVRLRMKERKDRPLSDWQNFKYERAMRWKKFKTRTKDTFSSVEIWKEHLKEVEGLFGTGVLSYFTFLRWLLYINGIVCILTMSFLFVPQIISNGKSWETNNETFTGLEILTGEGWFNNTEMFYGQYTSGMLNDQYDMKHAYLFVGAGYVLICIMVLAVSIANSYKENFIVSDGTLTVFCSKVFCSWDYGITNKESANIKLRSIAQDILETLGSGRGRVKVSCCSLLGIVMLRLFTNFIVLSLMAGTAYLIYFVSEQSVKENFQVQHEHHLIKAMYPAIALSAVNLIIPTGFRMIASIESYQSPKDELRINLVRTIALKLTSLVAYVATIYIQLNELGDQLQDSCWENFVGQAFYKLVIVDFIAVMLATFFEEFVRKLFSKHMGCCNKYAPGFDISKNVLNLIYAQGICWLGTFYCPMMPLINVLKLIFTFYVKKVSVVRNCRPSMRPFKASKMLVWFLCLLSIMLVLTLVVIGYVIMDNGTLRPSKMCGPFRGQESIYSLVSEVIEKMPSELKSVVNFISSVSVIAVIIFIIGLLAYYFRMRKISSEKKIALLKQQLSLAGRDKQYLISKLRQIMKTNPHVD